MTDLRTLLQTATDRLEAPHRVSAAIASGRRRRARARIAMVAVALVASGGGVGLLILDEHPATSGRPVDTPTTSNPSSAPPDGPATQPLWDPFDIPALPRGASPLPRLLDAPTTAEPVTGSPMGRVLLAWPAEGRDLMLLGDDGIWRSVPGTATATADTQLPVVRPVISRDGTRVAMSTTDGLLVLDVTDGTTTSLPWASELAPPWDIAPGLQWLADGSGLVVLHWRRPWIADLDGTMSEAPFRGRFTSLAVDSTGPIHQNDYQRRQLLTWADGQVSGRAPFVQCERLVASEGLVACTTGSLEPFRSGPVVVDSATGDVVAYAPIKDRNAIYSDNAHLTALGFLDDDRVLLLVGPADFRDAEREESWHLVEWNFRTGDLVLLSSGGADARTVVVASGLLGAASS